MSTSRIKSHGTQPSPTGHPLPRRASPANSITLRHHRLARDASLRASPGSDPTINSNATSSPRRDSSGDSHETGLSDPNKWFDQSNQNPMATFDSNTMDVDPPFFQRESDSSNEDKPYSYQNQASMHPHPPAPESSGAGDYRSVIDDLTVEIQKLKEELKRYKQDGPDMLRKDKLFEIKFHGLPKRKKRELETTLREFAASLEGSPNASSSQRKKSSRRTLHDNKYSASGSYSKHASSTSGSNARPVDSAYASMSTGAQSSLGRPSDNRTKSSEQKIASYLREIPEGLYPRHLAISEREKKKLVVRRLEQLFTGKIGGRHTRRTQTEPINSALAPVNSDGHRQQSQVMHQPPRLAAEAAREARIVPSDQPSGHRSKNTTSRDNGSTSNSNGDQAESGGNSSGTNPSPPMPAPPEQRPTRPKDLDPDRVQVPSENMEYIRHLGLVPPELLTEPQHNTDVHTDADGWVYLNLLCNLAQLHIINVTPNFVLSAVSDYSTKFQISPDGCKIRWRGGAEGTKFSSDSSGDNSQRSPDSDETDSSNLENNERKRQKTGMWNENSSGDLGNSSSKFGPQITTSSESFHYKPLFAQQASPIGQSSIEDTLSSFGPVDESNVEESRYGVSGSGASHRRKRRHDGAIIYYSGAPFCTDLSGDPGDSSPSYMISSHQDQPPVNFARPFAIRSESGSSLGFRPLSAMPHKTGVEADFFEETSDLEMDLPWSDDQQYIEVHALEPCGLGGVLPEDHFMVVVTTKRPKMDFLRPHDKRTDPDVLTNGIIRRLATMSTASRSDASSPSSRSPSPVVGIEYVSGRIKRLAPVALPPPAIFVPPFSSDSSSYGSDEMDSVDESDDDASSELMSRQANPHHSDGYPDGVDLSSGDEDGEDPDDELDAQRVFEKAESRNRMDKQRGLQHFSGGAVASAGIARSRSKSASAERMMRAGSLAATAGGVESGYSSSR